jgi:hypothetical protein
MNSWLDADSMLHHVQHVSDFVGVGAGDLSRAAEDAKEALWRRARDTSSHIIAALWEHTKAYVAKQNRLNKATVAYTTHTTHNRERERDTHTYTTN